MKKIVKYIAKIFLGLFVLCLGIYTIGWGYKVYYTFQTEVLHICDNTMDGCIVLGLDFCLVMFSISLALLCFVCYIIKKW
jgi:hypothetical protein